VADAFVLAAGLGTRLRPLTAEVPKSLVPVCGVPLLAYALAVCAKRGFRDVVVNAHWLADQVVAWEGEREGVRVRVSVEQPMILGTGGGLKKVATDLDAQFAVLNADVLHDADLGALVAAIPPGGAAMALRADATAAARYGVVATDETGTVARLTTIAIAAPVGRVRDDTFFTGIHALDREALERIPDGPACVVRSAYAALVPERRVRGLVDPGPWLDTGDLATYLDANLRVLRGDVCTPLAPHARAAFARDALGNEHGTGHGDIEGAAWIGPGARVDGRITDTVVGREAHVPSGATLVRCVVWDGVDVPHGVFQDAVFTPTGAVVRS
jgi:mannose-1-phosphate guanylyltransferase